jgi:hypothetical protein
VATLTDSFDGGSLSTFDVDSGAVCDHVTAATGDTVVSGDAGHLLQIDRLGHDRIRVFDPNQWAKPVAEFSTGRGSNPHAAAACGGGWLVSAYEDAAMSVFDEQGRRLSTIDLTDYADRDGIPEASSIVRRGDFAWVGLQRLDRNDGFEPSGRGVAIRVDCHTGSVVEAREGPTDLRLAPHPEGVVMYGSSGEVTLALDSGETRELARVGEEVAHAVFGSDGSGLLIVQPADLWYRLECLRPDGLRSTLMATDAYPPDAAVVDGTAWLAVRPGWADAQDRPTTVPVFDGVRSGLWPIDLASCALLSEAPAPLALAPFSLAPY